MSIGPPDKNLIDRLLALTRGLSGLEVGDAIGVTGTTVGRWRKGKYPMRGLHESTRARIEAVLAQPGWKYVASIPPSPVEEQEAAAQAAYAAGVLWTVAQQARHLAHIAEEAHTRITGIDRLPQQPQNPVIRKGKRGARIDVPPLGKKRA